MADYVGYYIPQFATTTLDVAGGITAAQTSDIKLTSVPSDIDITKAGVLCLTYTNPINTDDAEWITYTSIDGTNTLAGVTRGAEGYTAKTHDNGCTVAWVISKSHINQTADALTGVTTGVALSSPTLTTPVIPSLYQDSGKTKLMTVPNTASDTLAAIAATQTLTNKRITQRVVTTTDDATAVIDCAVTDQYELSAIANATEFTVTGTPTDGQKLIIRYKDAGVAKGLTFTGFTAMGVTIPTTTTAGKWEYVGAIYNSAATTWHVVAVGTEE